jgi:signal transduction histidine kinase
VFLLLDVVSTLIGQAYGLANLGRSGLVPAAQMFLVVAAAAATMYSRPRAAIGLTALVVVLVFTVGPSGEEFWLLVITAVTAAVRADGWQLGLVVLAQTGYAVAFGFQVEQQYPGWGWTTGLLTVGFAAAAVTAGLIARRLLRTRDQQRLRVADLEREQSEIRAIERGRLADELQAVVTQGLVTIENELDDVARRSSDLQTLRAGLEQIDHHSRSLLTALRTLLDILRRDPAAEPDLALAVHGSGSRRWVDLVRARHVRLAASAVCGLLAARAALGLDTRPAADVTVEIIGLLACAVAVWRPAVGAAGAGTALALSCVLDPPGHWDVVSSTLLCLIGALRLGPRRIWLLVLAVAGYAGLVALTDASEPRTHVVLLCYVAGLAIAIGLAARHFLAAREDSLRQLLDLAQERERVKTEERNAVARELHDVVAHSLSVTTMLVMATSLSEDPETLASTLAKVRRSTTAAHHELSTLLHAMRAPGVDGAQPVLTSPRATARALGEQLTASGHHPEMEIDPRADTLDVTTQRTLARIMQEATTNILRYAPARAVCSYAVTVDGDGVRLRVTSPLATGERGSDLSLGWGLRGIRERVELTHGTFSAGPDQGRWVLAVSLPAATESVDPPPRAAAASSSDRLVAVLPMEG